MRALVLLALLASCDAYDRDLGPAPFLCGPTEPRCPVDYTCQEDPNTNDEICVGSDSATSSIDCADDGDVEPNNTLPQATVTSLDAMAAYHHDSLAICPPNDKDTFAITLAHATRIDLEVVYEGGAPLYAAILNQGGVPIATATVTEASRTLHATASTLPAGTYYGQISAPNGRSNNYTISLRAD